MRTDRHKKILELINNNNIGTQEELADALNKAGYNVTQATVSRDIRELKLTKIPTSIGKQKYAVIGDSGEAMAQKYERGLRDAFISGDMAQNILVIKTVAGMANAVCAAIDAMNMKEIVGSVAGDDTIMCAVRTVDDTLLLMKKIRKIVE